MTGTPADEVESLRSDVARRVDAALHLPAALEGDVGAVDKYRIHADPVILRGVAALLADQLPDDIEVLVGVEVGGIAVAAALALHAGLPWAVGRRAHGERLIRRTVGTDVSGRRVAMVNDLASRFASDDVSLAIALSMSDLRRHWA